MKKKKIPYLKLNQVVAVAHPTRMKILVALLNSETSKKKKSKKSKNARI
jgi:hypothetical protein